MLALDEISELDSVQKVVSATKPCAVPEAGGKAEVVGRGGAQGAGGGFGSHFEAIDFDELQDLLTGPASGGSARDQGKRKKLCIVQSAEDAMTLSNSFSAVHQFVNMFLKDDTFVKIELIMGDTHCPEDGSRGPDSSCHVKISQTFLSELIREDYSQVEKVSVRWLKEPLVWADISRPARLSYQILEWLAKLDPLEDPEGKLDSGGGERDLGGDTCDSTLFLTPHLAHYSALAKRQGLGLKHSNIVVYFEHKTSSGKYALLREELPILEEVEQQEAMYMEATAASLADVTIVDNTALLGELDRQAKDYLPEFMRVPEKGRSSKEKDGAGGLAMPGRHVYVLPFAPSSIGAKDASGGQSEKHLVKALRFEGTFTNDNGLGTMLDALSWMHANVTEIGEVEVSFSGTDAWVSNVKYRGGRLSQTRMGSEIIKTRLGEMRGYKLGVHTQRSEVMKAKSRGGVRVIVQFGGSGGGVRNVLQAVLQNAPFIAYESILTEFARSLHVTDEKFLEDLKARHGIRDPGFDVKGIELARLMWSKVRDEVSRKDCIASSGVYRVVSQYTSDSKSRFLNLYKKMREGPWDSKKQKPDTSKTKVSVVLVHHNRPDKVQQAVKSLVYQSHKKTEIIIIDNASTHSGTGVSLEAIKALAPEAEIIRLQAEVSLSSARNLGASKASGDYLLFMDDDNVAKTREIEIMLMTAMNTEADIVSPGNQYFVSEGSPYDGVDTNAIKAINKWMPLGPSPSIGVYKDVFGDSNALFRKSSFDRYGGFEEHKKVHSSWEGEMAKAAGEDWELMARMTLGGANLQVVPIPLFWYRLSPDALSKTSPRNLYLGKVISPFVSTVERYADEVPSLNYLAPALKMAQSAYHMDSLRSPKMNLGGLDTLFSMVRATTFSQFNHGCTLDDLVTEGNGKEAKDNLLKNSKFEDLDVEEAAHWESFGSGYEATRYIEGIKLTSKSISDQYGAKQTIKLKTSSDRPIFIAAQSTQVEGLPSRFPEGYSLYVDLEYEDRTMGYGYMVTFSRPLESQAASNNATTTMTGVKRWRCGLIVPTKPVKTIYFHMLYRNVVGSVIFHEGIVRQLDFQDVCKAFVGHPLTEMAKAQKSANDSSTAATGANEAGSITMDCQGHFSRHTPILL
ncbi:glycosyltransferase [Chloropicon primus]|uniref:Glycosyltransferase n=3 Tax=Chloropicon primus TaxID=1764295 RepID=A0A5B8MZ47_9CHLO|nr:glycosyltransferase [Chloropicon primus]|eukprot:QDZ24684.1 glycosyltransferase [Chloropicon primus]